MNRKSAKIIPKIDEALARGQSLTRGVCMPPRTIDNLGVEVSTRYAEDKQILGETLVKEIPIDPDADGDHGDSPLFLQ